MGQSKTARLATMAWYGWDIVGLSYGFAAIPLSRNLPGVAFLYGLGS